MNSPLPLFRKEAQEARRTSTLGEIVLLRPVSFSFLTAAAAAMAALVVLYGILGSYTRRTTVDGVVLPDAGIVKVFAPQAGVVIGRDVVEGQHVKRGQALYTVSTELQSVAKGRTQAALIEETKKRRASLLAEIEKTKMLQQQESNTQQAKVVALNNELDRINDQLRSQRVRTSIAADAAKRYGGLLVQDYVSKDQAQQKDADYLDQQFRLYGLERERVTLTQSLTDARSELKQLIFKHDNVMSQLGRNITEIDQTLIESEAKRQLVIAAPASGVATALILQAGQMVDASRPVASIIPAHARWEAHLFVPSSSIGFVRVGAPVLIRYQAFPYQKFGQYGGKVLSIARAALSSTELANEIGNVDSSGIGARTYYRVTVALDEQTVTVYGKQLPLQAGMTLQAAIIRDRRQIYEWVLEPLYTLTGKIKR